MKLEPIDTSTTEGKIEVMRLSSEGRRLAYCHSLSNGWEVHTSPEICSWNWGAYDYAIIAEPVGPEEVWVVLPKNDGNRYEAVINQGSADFASGMGRVVVRYVRADD